MLLRDVGLGDVAAYVRMRCDPVMTAELGGPQPRDGIEDKVRRDAAEAAAGTSLIKMIIPDPAEPAVVAGSVTLWSHQDSGVEISEIGWMVLPEFQGQGVGKRAVRALLELARGENRWGVVHAFPAVTNAPSNALCRSVGFRLAGQVDTLYAGRTFRTNHWFIDPRTDLS
jgi:RimJ/RimL family protein N-acetyltransferase